MIHETAERADHSPRVTAMLSVAAGLIAGAGLLMVIAAGFALSFDAVSAVGRAASVASFATMMADREGHRLPAWLDQADATDLAPLRSLARGIRQDFDAVTAGLTLEWNSGRVEGNVNRIKRIRRDGYGRANFGLLRLQILHAD